MPVRLIVTRPERDAQRWVHELGRSGVPAEALPLIGIAALPAAAAIKAAWSALPDFSALMFVSANAVECFFGPLSAPFDAGQTRFMAPGPGTVAALVEAGLPAASIDAPPADAAQFDSESLWQEVGSRDWRGTRVLIVRGQSLSEKVTNGKEAAPGAASAAPGRDWLARQLNQAGADVTFLSVYERRAPRLDGPQRLRIEEASRDGSVWLFSSSEAIGHLRGLALDWSKARAIATHPRIAEAARALGWGVVLESRPKPVDIVAAWASIESAAR
jgi:uroporphyrinogen-III synthase